MTLWHDPDFDLPPTDEDVLAIVSGHTGPVPMDRAMHFAFWDGCAWVLSDVTRQPSELTVHLWTPRPRDPGAVPDRGDAPEPKPAQTRYEFRVNVCPVCGRRPIVSFDEAILYAGAAEAERSSIWEIRCGQCGLSCTSLDRWNKLRLVTEG